MNREIRVRVLRRESQSLGKLAILVLLPGEEWRGGPGAPAIRVQFTTFRHWVSFLDFWTSFVRTVSLVSPSNFSVLSSLELYFLYCCCHFSKSSIRPSRSLPYRHHLFLPKHSRPQLSDTDIPPPSPFRSYSVSVTTSPCCRKCLSDPNTCGTAPRNYHVAAMVDAAAVLTSFPAEGGYPTDDIYDDAAIAFLKQLEIVLFSNAGAKGKDLVQLIKVDGCS